MLVKPRYYLDSCCIIDMLEYAPTVDPALTLWRIFEDAESGKCTLVTSVITIAESFKLKSEVDKRTPSQAVEDALSKLWHPGSSPIELVDVHELIAREANALLRRQIPMGWGKTGGRDAIHLITAKREGVTEFFSNGEKAMKKWEPIVGFPIVAPHWSPPIDPTDQMFGTEQS